MATPIRTKRITRERANLEKPNDDYFVHFNDDDLFSFYAYVIGPADTLYAHKFVKLRFDIPERYPLVRIMISITVQPEQLGALELIYVTGTPKVKFIQHTGGRIHPNLYVEGKVCLSILGTWPGEKWAYAMTIETVLITIRSLLDNAPYKHEPHQADNLNFNQYVQYTTWKSLLLDYVYNESDAACKQFLEQHITKHGANMIDELHRQSETNSAIVKMSSPYGQPANVNYTDLLQKVSKMVDQCKTSEAGRQALRVPPSVPTADQETALVTTDDTKPSLMEAPIPPSQLPSSRPPASLSAKDKATVPLKRKHEVNELD